MTATIVSISALVKVVPVELGAFGVLGTLDALAAFSGVALVMPIIALNELEVVLF